MKFKDLEVDDYFIVVLDCYVYRKIDEKYAIQLKSKITIDIEPDTEVQRVFL